LVFGTLGFGTLVFGTLVFGTLVFGTLVFGILVFGTLVFGTWVLGYLVLWYLVNQFLNLGYLVNYVSDFGHFVSSFSGVRSQIILNASKPPKLYQKWRAETEACVKHFNEEVTWYFRYLSTRYKPPLRIVEPEQLF
jgi:hypothetical protein